MLLGFGQINHRFLNIFLFNQLDLLIHFLALHYKKITYIVDDNVRLWNCHETTPSHTMFKKLGTHASMWFLVVAQTVKNLPATRET